MGARRRVAVPALEFPSLRPHERETCDDQKTLIINDLRRTELDVRVVSDTSAFSHAAELANSKVLGDR